MPNSIVAANARRVSVDWNRTVAEEIAVIDIYIAAALDSNAVTATVGSNTTVAINGVNVTGTAMTSNTATGQLYHNVWQGVATDVRKSAEMDTVIKHFTDLGYSIGRRSNGTLFSWSITWY